jgi:hypothetical protein
MSAAAGELPSESATLSNPHAASSGGRSDEDVDVEPEQIADLVLAHFGAVEAVAPGGQG